MLIESDDDEKVILEEEGEVQETEEEVPRQETPLPLKPFFVICCVVLSEAFSVTMIFPFLADMVKDFGVAADDGEIGFYAGWIASSFNLAQFIAAFMWGTIYHNHN
jgi:hypothetical protein